MTVQSADAIVDVQRRTRPIEEKLGDLYYLGKIQPDDYTVLMEGIVGIEKSVQSAASILAQDIARAISMRTDYENRLKAIRPRGALVNLVKATMGLLSQSLPIVLRSGETHLGARIDTLLWIDGDTTGHADKSLDVLLDIMKERKRQIEKWGSQDGHDDATSLRITLEEFGEVAKAMNEHDDATMEKEIEDTAACLVAWLERRRLRVDSNQ